MKSATTKEFKRNYDAHLKHLRLKGLQPKTIEAYARTIRRIGGYFDHRIDDLSEQQLTDYFNDLLASHSWSAVKLDLYGLMGANSWLNGEGPSSLGLPEV
jgi:integrase/recombinase XerD